MSVRALARELGVSQAAVQHHAPTKEALLCAVIDEVVVPQLAHARTTAASLAAGPATSPEQVRALVRQRIEALVAGGGLVQAVLADTSSGCVRRQARLLAALRPERQAALQSLATLADLGVTRRVSPTTWTVLSIAAIPAIAQAWQVLERVDPELAVDRDQVLGEVADLLVLGLLPR